MDKLEINADKTKIVIQASVYKDIAMEIRKMEHNVTYKKTVKAWFAIIIGAGLWDRWC